MGRGDTTLVRRTDTHDDDIVRPAGIFVALEEFHGFVIDDGGVRVVDSTMATAVAEVSGVSIFVVFIFFFGGGKQRGEEEGGGEYMSN